MSEHPEKEEPGHDEGMTHGARRAVLALFVTIVILATASLILGARTANHLTQQVQSQCGFDADLAGLPITVNPATHKASILGVKIVSDARIAWHQADCPGQLAQPSPSFIHWANYYRYPIN